MATSNVKTVALPAVADITMAEALKASLEEALADEPSRIELDGSPVERITTPCLQLIYTAHKQADAHEKGSMVFANTPSEALVNAFRDLGMGETLTAMEQ